MHGRGQSCGRLHIVAAIVELQAQLIHVLEEQILFREQLTCALAAMLRRAQAGIPAAIETPPQAHGTHAGNGTQHELGAMGERGEERVQILIQ